MIITRLRERVESLLFSGAGVAAYVIDTGRFTEHAPDRAEFQASSERRVVVSFGLAEPVSPYNPLDGFMLVQRLLTLTIEYARTGGGTDLAEGYTQQTGGGTDDEIMDRMGHDQYAISRCLLWHENWESLDPHVFSIEVLDAGTAEFDGETATLSLLYRVFTRDNTLAAYSI